MIKICNLLITASVAVALAVAWAPAAIANGVEPRFDLTDPSGSPFPSDRFTVPDATQLTGLRVDLPKPWCRPHPSDCPNVLNTLDGFNLEPRISIPFTGTIDVSTVSSQTVFLFKLGSDPGRVGINQVVWDPDTDTLYAESDQTLDQHTSYLLVVTSGVRDTAGDPIDTTHFANFLNAGQTDDQSGKAYRSELLAGLDQLAAAGVPTDQLAAASVFTTESATAVMEKMRDQVNAATPAPADFVIGAGGERTVFTLAGVTGISWRRQATTGNATTPPTFTTAQFPLKSLRVVPGAIGTIAFGRYSSPDYENSDGVIPAVGTRTGVPAVQTTNEIYFTLFLPAGPEPTGGWPVVIAGHGAGGGGKNMGNVPFSVAAKLAQHGLATITINDVGFTGGPLGTITVNNTNGTTVTLPDGGRGVDRNQNAVFDHPTGSLPEGLYTRPDGPDAIVFVRDGFRQTVVDLMRLTRVLQVGVDVDGDGTPDLDPNRVYYFGQSLGGFIGFPFAALEPSVRASVLSEAGGSFADALRLNAAGPFRTFLGRLLARTPSLLNLAPGAPDPINPGNPLAFDENLPPRCPEPCTNTVAGAIAIQNEIERIEWAEQSGDPIAYAPHLRKEPLDGVPVRPVLIPFGQGDPVAATTTIGNLLRAGDLADRTIYFRTLDAYAQLHQQPSAAQLHEWLVSIAGPNISGPGGCFALAGQESADTFLASDGTVTVDPDTFLDPLLCPSPFFETPITGPLP
jgi:dienelactone hydrolase